MGEKKTISPGHEYKKGWNPTVNEEQKDSIRRMFAKARDKMETARMNFENGKFDDAVSRSYYAVFFAISAALFSGRFSFSPYSQGNGGFNREFVKTGFFPASFTKMIKLMFNERQTGDYDFDSWIDEQTAEESIENAETIISGIEKYLDTLGSK
jgi:uncharacterized protein (UPF0332 family)